MHALRSHLRWSHCLVAAVAFVLPACTADGHLQMFGYSTRPNYDPGIRTVRVPIFENTTPRLGVEFELTRAIIREIEAKTPFKVVSDPCAADTELTGRIVSFFKKTNILTQTGEIRDGETTMTVELVWRDLRPGSKGECLSLPSRARPTDPPILPETLGPPPASPPPVIVQSLATFTPELGESITTAQKTMVDRMAIQIVSMMEKPW
ncbi:MAG: LptE family protein [Gemmataceae bacterium]|nr:LptE family protein [Gemmataceae bacterium]